MHFIPFLALTAVAHTMPNKLFFGIAYNARLMDAREAHALHIVNAVMPRAQVLARAIEAIAQATRGNPDILLLGRDLFYAGRGLSPTSTRPIAVCACRGPRLRLAQSARRAIDASFNLALQWYAQMIYYF